MAKPRTSHNDEKLLKMVEEYGIDNEQDSQKQHDLWESLTEEYNKFLGDDGKFTSLQVRRRRYAIKYQPRKNEIRNQKALEQRIAIRNDQQQQSQPSTKMKNNEYASVSKATVPTKAELKEFPSESPQKLEQVSIDCEASQQVQQNLQRHLVQE